MHTLTQRGKWEMRVDYQKNDKTWSYLHYNQFSVGNASEEYPLTVGGFTGVGTDWFNDQSFLHNGMKFTTSDNDNDKWSDNVTVQLHGRADGGMMTVTILTSTDNHLL